MNVRIQFAFVYFLLAQFTELSGGVSSVLTIPYFSL
jgi:hypothetical protein